MTGTLRVEPAPELGRTGPGGEPDTERRWWHELLGIGWIVAAAIAVLLPALVHGSSLGPYDVLARFGLSRQPGVAIRDLHGDQITQMIPWTQLAWTQVHQGHLPLWNSYSGLGMPLAFNWQSATFSVPAIVGYLVPLRLAFTFQVLTTLVVAGSGGYVLGRVLKLGALPSALIGTAFELSGAFMFWLGWPIGSVLSWTGWLFAGVLLVMRGTNRARTVAFFALILACAIYAGQPDALVVLAGSVVLFALVLLVTRLPIFNGSGPLARPVVDLLLGSAFGAALAAPLLLPGYQIASGAIRTVEGSTFGRQTTFSVQDLGHLALSGLNGIPNELSLHLFVNNPNIYLGVIVIVLAITAIALSRRRPEIIALIAVVVVMGVIAFLQSFDDLIHLVPGLQAVRWYRAVVPMVLAISVLAGVGLELIVSSYRDRQVRIWLGAGFVVSSGCLVVAWALGLPHLTSGEVWTRDLAFLWSAAQTVVGLLGVAALTRASGQRRSNNFSRRAPRIVAASFLACVTVFLVFSGETLWHSSPTYVTTTPAITTLEKTVGSSLVGFGSKKCFAVPGLGIYPDANDLYGIHELAIYDPMLPRSYFISWGQATRRPPNSAGVPLISSYCPAITSAAIARVYGVSYVLQASDRPGPKGGILDKHLGDENLFRIPGAGPATLTPIPKSGELPPTRAVGVAVPVTYPGPSSWKVVTNAPTNQVLRLRLTAVPGWHASIDGKPLSLKPFTAVMVQARIPSGRHVIELHYWPTAFTAGIAMAVVGVIGLAGWVLVDELRRRPDRNPR